MVEVLEVPLLILIVLASGSLFFLLDFLDIAASGVLTTSSKLRLTLNWLNGCLCGCSTRFGSLATGGCLGLFSG
jgi:hypothetical protein